MPPLVLLMLASSSFSWPRPASACCSSSTYLRDAAAGAADVGQQLVQLTAACLHLLLQLELDAAQLVQLVAHRRQLLLLVLNHKRCGKVTTRYMY